MQLYNLFMKSAPKMEHLKNKTLRFLSDANIITIRPQHLQLSPPLYDRKTITDYIMCN